MDEINANRKEILRSFGEFLDQGHIHEAYADKIKDVLDPKNSKKGVKPRLDINLQDLQRSDKQLYDDLLSDPAEGIPACEEALDEYARNLYPKALKVLFSHKIPQRSCDITLLCMKWYSL